MVPSMQAQILSPPQPHASLPESFPSFAPTPNGNIPDNLISSTSSSPSFLTEEHVDRFGLENIIGSGDEGDNAHRIGSSLLRGLSGGLHSEDEDDDRWSRSNAGQPGRGEAGHGGVHQEDDEVYAEALSRVGMRDSLNESTVEGLGYAPPTITTFTVLAIHTKPKPTSASATRERRPSMTPSATSNDSGYGSQAGTIGEWEHSTYSF